MYPLHTYFDMMTDERRMEGYESAMRRLIRPGDIVLDLGAGTGVLSFIALAAGAAHVYALERSPVIEVARKLAQANKLADRITFIQGDARSVTPPKQVDCLVGDVRGAVSLFEENVDVFESVRARWLRPGGTIIPIQDELYVAPVASAAAHERVRCWSALKRPEASYEAATVFAANEWTRTLLAKEDVVAPAQALGAIEYTGMTARRFDLKTEFIAERDGTLTGLGVWFKGTYAEGIVQDTSPYSPPSVYGQGYLPITTVRPIKKGQPIEVTVSVHRHPPNPIWTWNLRSSSAGDSWRENHSSLLGSWFGLTASPLLQDQHRPALSEDGEITRLLINAVDGKNSVNALATLLSSTFPHRFPSPDQAQHHVMRILRLNTLP
jgi:SAM-dependent methyltransferase